MIKDPEAGDFVRLSGRIIQIHGGTALVEVYRSDPVGLRVPVQCGALEHVGPAEGDDMAPVPDVAARPHEDSGIPNAEVRP